MKYKLNVLQEGAPKMTLKNFLLLLLIMAVIFLLTFLMEKSQEPKNYKEHISEINQIKNTITEEKLLNSKIATWNCSFNINETDLKELTECFIKSRPIIPIRNTPEASVEFKEDKQGKYFKITIEFYNLYDSRGVAVVDVSLYDNNKRIASDIFSCSELTDLCVKYFPEVFNRIQRENDSRFYRQ